MIHIGKSYIQRVDSTSRLCADITIGDRRNTLWFSVDRSQESYLCVGRADAFVMAFLAAAMRGNHTMVCDDPMSERLHYQLSQYLIPTLAFAGKYYHRFHISAPLTSKPYPNKDAVGTAYSSGVDSLYTIMRHGRDYEYPISHLVVYNSSHYDQFGKKRQEMFLANCRQAVLFAQTYGLQTVIVDTNFFEVLGGESRMTVFSFRNVACTLALQGLLSHYLVSSAGSENLFTLDCIKEADHSANYRFDRLTLANCHTESLTLFFSGTEVERWQKLQALTTWKPSMQWLHPCFFAPADKMNCGHCTKCICDMVTLYAFGMDVLNRYSTVYDIPDFLRQLPQRIAYVLVNADSDRVSFGQAYRAKGALQALRENKAYIPPAAYVYEKLFRRTMNHDTHR